MNFILKLGKYQQNTKEEITVLTIDKTKKITSPTFLILYSQQKANIKTKPITKLTDELFEKFTDEQLISYYNENLENEFPEFRYVMMNIVMVYCYLI